MLTMKKFFNFKKFLLLIFIGCNLLFGFAQNLPQINNSGFEQWEGSGLSIEPESWNSFMTCEVVNSNPLTQSLYQAILRNQQVEPSNSTRPGSAGLKSARIFARDTTVMNFNITANGNITTGRIYAEDLDLNLAGNKTKTNEAGFNHPFTATPDSLTLWVRNNCVSLTQQSYVSAVIHNHSDFFLPLSGLNNYNNAVGFAYTTFQNEGNIWKRLSIPFDYESCQSNDPQYILIVINTNVAIDASLASGDDEIFIDDILLVYNPTITVGEIATTSFTLNPTSGTAIEIPFTITGTMSPSNLNASNNIVTAQLSNANGSFENPIILGSLTTNESGVINGIIPAETPKGNGYRVRVVTTNYPMTSEDNGEDLTFNYPFYHITVAANPTAGGTVTGEGDYEYGSNVTVSAVPNDGFNFVNWTNNDAQVSTATSYSFVITEDINLIANFNEQGSYVVTVSATPTGAGTVSGSGSYVEGSSVTVSTTANYGYTFSHWTKNDETVSTDLEYTFIVQENSNCVANYTPNTYSVTVSANPVIGGTVFGGGHFNFGSTVTVFATPYPEYVFSGWTHDNDTVSTSENYSFTISGDIQLVGHFTHKNSIAENQKKQLNVYTVHQNIVVEAPEDGNIYVYNMMGQLVTKVFGKKGTNNIAVRQNGIYIVIMNGISCKVMVY